MGNKPKAPDEGARANAGRTPGRPEPQAQRLKGVFDIEACCEYGGAVRVIACIEDPVVIEKTLAHLDKKDAKPPRWRLACDRKGGARRPSVYSTDTRPASN